MACPVTAASRTSAGRAMPSATSSCSRTRSRPVTSSVTGCSTWSRVLTSKKAKRPSGRNEELDGAGVHVADGAGHGDRRRPELGPLVPGVSAGGGALLDDLLVAALDRALALEEVHHVAVGVPEDLHLDVAGPRRRRARRTPCRRRRPRRLRAGPRPGRRPSASGPCTTRMPRPPPPAEALTRTGQPRAATASRTASSASCRSPPPPGISTVGSTGTPAAGHGGLGGELRAHGLDHVGRGAHEDEPRRHAGPGEPGVLGQEPVARGARRRPRWRARRRPGRRR